jgi:MurNAc alpha-1-phosphate uridylyltransferase
MALAGNRIAREGTRLTYGNIGVFHPRVFADLDANRSLALFPWAYRLVDAGHVSGEHFSGRWANIGTPEDLQELDRELCR